MLKKSFRLTKSDIERLYKKGRFFSQAFILARTMPNKTDHARFTVIVPKRVMVKATDRNRAKRMIYQWLGSHEDLYKDHHFDLSLSIRSQFDEKNINTVLTSILGLIK